MRSMMSRIAWFKDLNRNSLSIAGGKGANLGEMFNLGMPVPPGFCVTAQTYKEFIDQMELTPKITQLLNNLDPENNDRLQQVGDKIQQLIISTPVPEEMAEEIVESYELLGMERKNTDSLVHGNDVFV